tara:strand:- start:4098 stop:4583 length:486 start_codon:yes stop_codon:yes gene_type:complete
MSLLKSNFWFDPKGNTIDIDDLIVELRAHTKDKGRIFIGTDSFMTKDICVFVTAVCLHGAENQQGGRYFLKRDRVPVGPFRLLVTRMLEEVTKTVNTTLMISETCPEANLELHLDISTSPDKGATGKYAEQLTGYAKSTGFPIRTKPDSWASSAVADKHSK